jgi:putative endonuclease
MTKWFVYVLLCSDNSLYTGISPNVDKRFIEHQKGIASKYTRAHPPIQVVYQEACLNHSVALQREYEIKQWTRAQKIHRLKLKLP